MDNLKETSNSVTPKAYLLMEYLPQLMLGILIAALIVLFEQSQLQDSWRFDRNLISEQPWLVISHAFIHLNAQHLALNITALLTLFVLFMPAFRSLWWLAALAVSAISSACGVFYYSPDTQWLVGLSGALHGLFVYTVLRSGASLAWIAALVIKISIEQYPQYFPLDAITHWNERLIDSAVIVDAHLWGAIGGLLFFLMARTAATLLVVIELNQDQKK